MVDEENPSDASMPVRAVCFLALWVITADYLLYRTFGFSGPAAFFALAPVMILVCQGRDRVRGSSASHPMTLSLWSFLVVGAAARLAYCGNGYVMMMGALSLFALGLAVAGVFPWALETIAAPGRTLLDGVIWFFTRRFSGAVAVSPTKSLSATLSFMLPTIAVLAFSGLFVLANPDLLEWVSERWRMASHWARDWISSLDGLEVAFCVFMMFIGAGILFPKWGRHLIGGIDAAKQPAAPSQSVLFPAFRNTLICLIGLFAVYLIFEFGTLWRREFPPGFYYAGYAHQGAAWLTVALALATGTLSVVFRGSMLGDPRLGQLKTLAWIWSFANLLLALAVYNRLAIYVGYNGLTPMRIVGFYGITVVVVGFALVVAKIIYQKGFWWLLRMQLTALLLFVVLHSMVPQHLICHSYNVRTIRRGYLPPVVMVAVKEMDDSGYLPLFGLIDHEDRIVRQGVRAMLAERQISIEQDVESRPWHWTRYQRSTDQLYVRLAEHAEQLENYLDPSINRQAQINAFRDYAMQWY